jgi:exosortase
MIPRVGSLVRSVPPARAATLMALGTLCLWAYWPTLAAMCHKWLHDPQYSHGYLVPAFAVVLLWLRRPRMAASQWAPCWWGILLVLGGTLFRLAAVYAYFDWLDGASLLFCLAGICVLLGGWQALRWAWPAIAFLLFMIPLPYRLETALAQPLQGVATRGSTYLMQTLGLPALAEGNTILLSRGRIGVVEACNGLSMMLVFFALATALAIVIRRPLLDKAVILLSAAPIAVIVNVLRITATGVAQELGSPEAAQSLFHDWAGWLMMVVALGLLWAELRLLACILVPGTTQGESAGLPPPPIGTVVAGSSVNDKKAKRQRQAIPAPPLTSRP